MKKQNRNNPWAGLASYEDPTKSERKLRFCGRDNDIYDVTHLIDDNLLMVLYGKSGIGKTSLLNAGVFPQLRLEQYLPISIRLGTLETSSPYQEAIISAIENAIEEIHGEVSVFNVVEEQTDNQLSNRLWNYFARHRFANSKGQPLFPVVVLDQFEEILRNTTPEHVSKAQTLLCQLQYLVDESHALSDCIVDGHEYYYDFNFRFVISIREDELYLLEDNIDDLSLSMFRNCRYRLRPMKPEQARQVVLVPGKDCIEEKEKEKVTDRVIFLASQNKGNIIDTLLLSLVCCNTYERKTHEKLRLVDFTFWGDNPMEKYYSLAVESLPKKAVRYIQLHLINEDGSRNRVIASEIISQLGESVFNRLYIGENRILKNVEDNKLELLHDQLAMVINEERKAFEEREKKEAIEQERNKLCVLQSRLVLTKVKSIVDSDSYLARRLAVEVLPKNMEIPDRPYVPEVDAALRYSSYRNNMVLCGHNNIVYSALFSPDGTRLLSTSSGIIKIWDVKTGAVLQTIESSFSGAVFYRDSRHILVFPDSYPNSIEIRDLDTGEIIHHSVSKDFVSYGCVFHNNVVVTSNDSARIDLRDVSTGAIIKTFYGEEDEYFTQCMSISSDGIMIAAGTDDRIRVWNTITNESMVLSHGHNDMVYAVAFSPGGKNLVSASWDRTLKIWDIETRKVIMALKGHSDKVFSVAYSADGKMIVSGSEDNTAILWDSTTGVALRVLEGHTDAIESVGFSPDCRKIVSSSHDQTIRIWDVEKNPELQRIKKMEPSVLNPIAINPIGSNMAFSCENSLILWDIKKQVAVQSMCNHKSNINAIAYSPDGERVITASADHIMMLWNVNTGDLIRKFIGHTGEVRSVSYSPNQGQVASTSNDRTLRLWDIESGKCLYTIYVDAWMVAYNPSNGQIVFSTMKGEMAFMDPYTYDIVYNKSSSNAGFLSFAISPDGQKIVSLSRHGALDVWDAETGNCLNIYNDSSIIPLDNIRIGSVAFNSDGKRIVFVTGKCCVKLWDLVSGTLIRSYSSHFDTYISSVVFSPNEDAIIGTSANGIVALDIIKRSILFLFQKPLLHLNKIIAISPDNSLLAVAHKDSNLLIIRHCETGIIHQILLGHKKPINSLSFSPDGSFIVTTSLDHTMKVWEVNTGLEIGSFYRSKELFDNAIFSSDGTKIANTSRLDNNEVFDDYRFINLHEKNNRFVKIDKNGNPKVCVKTIMKMECSTFEFINDIELIGHDGVVNTAFFSPDGEKIVTASCDNNIMVWNASNGTLIHCLKGHTSIVNYAEFSMDGHYIVSASDDHTVKLWDSYLGTLLVTLKGHQGGVVAAIISPDNQQIVSVSVDKTIVFWNAKTGERIKEYNNCIFTNNIRAEFSIDGKYVRIGDGKHSLCYFTNSGEYALNPIIRVWDYESDSCISMLGCHRETVNSIRFSADGKLLVSASNDSEIKIWNPLTGELKKTISNDNNIGIKHAVFDERNESVVSINNNNSLIVRRIDSGIIIRQINNIKGQCRISPNGRCLLSNTNNNTVSVCDIESSITLQTIESPEHGYDIVMFSPNGDKILLVKNDSVSIWDFPPLQELIDQTRVRFKNCPFTDEEKRMYYLE